MNNTDSGPERNNFKNSEHQQQANTVNTVFLKKEQETAETGVCSGLSLLVAAVDAQDSELSSKFERPNSGLSMDGYSSTSHSPHSAENCAGQGETKNGRRRSIPDSEKDDCYWEKRRRNNEAAKKSREKRRLNDMAMESRLLELSKENNLLRSELNCVAKQPVKPEPQTPSIHHNTTPTPLQPPTGCVPFTRVPSQAAPAETMLPNPPIPTNPLTGLPAPNPPTAPPHPALAAALNANPAAALPQSLLTAMLPPSALLQQLSAAYSQAHAAALLATQQPHMLPPQPKPPVCAASQSLPLLTGTFGGTPPAKQASPDSTVEKVLKSPANQNSSMDGKQYLRYKLLERQNKRLNPPPTLGTPGTSPLGSLLAQRADSSFRESVITRQNSLPAVKNQEPSGGQLTVKQCLSSLAVHLGSDRSATGSGRSDSSVTGSEGSQVSPASSHGSSVSQASPPHAILDALGISNGNHECSNAKINGNCQNLSESERYIERRRRNNEAAKRCRANRRALFEYRFKRAQELEQENVQLKEEMQRLSRELMELKELLARKNGRNGLLPTFPTLPTSAEENDGFSTAQEVTVGVQNGGESNFVQNGHGHDVHTPTSGDFSSESGNDENYVQSSESGNLVIAEDLS